MSGAAPAGIVCPLCPEHGPDCSDSYICEGCCHEIVARAEQAEADRERLRIADAINAWLSKWRDNPNARNERIAVTHVLSWLWQGAREEDL